MCDSAADINPARPHCKVLVDEVMQDAYQQQKVCVSPELYVDPI